MDIFTSTQFRRTASALACTLVFSSVCVLGAVAPARADTLPTSADKRAWNKTVNTRLTQTLRPMASVPDAIRARSVAVVATHFDASGGFTGASLVRSSGNLALDTEALRAASQVKYPKLPASLQGRPQAIATKVVFGRQLSIASARDVARATRKIAGTYAARPLQSASLPQG